MIDSSLQHRLAAILAADAAGYSRLMSIDDKATVAALDAPRSVFCTQVQAQMKALADAESPDRCMRFRIGVHLGDVIEKADGTV